MVPGHCQFNDLSLQILRFTITVPFSFTAAFSLTSLFIAEKSDWAIGSRIIITPGIGRRGKTLVLVVSTTFHHLRQIWQRRSSAISRNQQLTVIIEYRSPLQSIVIVPPWQIVVILSSGNPPVSLRNHLSTAVYCQPPRCGIKFSSSPHRKFVISLLLPNLN